MPKNQNNAADTAFVAGALVGNGANVCRQFARVIGGTVVDQTADSCGVLFPRPELAATILGRPYETAAMFAYQSPDGEGLTLNTGEIPLLQREVNPFIDVLRANAILVAAVHTYWLFDRPRLVYVHFQSVSDPLVFAQAVADALAVLNVRPADTE